MPAKVGNTYVEGPNGAVQFVTGGERHLKFWFYTPEPELGMPNVDPDGSKASASGLRSVRALYKVSCMAVRCFDGHMKDMRIDISILASRM